MYTKLIVKEKVNGAWGTNLKRKIWNDCGTLLQPKLLYIKETGDS